MAITDSLLAACARRPFLAAGALLGYSTLVAATHDEVQDLAYWCQRTFGPAFWKPAVAVTGGLVLVAATVAARRGIARSDVRREAAVAWWTAALLLVAAFFTLLATNMESIHFVQYALPVLPLYALLRRFDLSYLAAATIGALDETFQYAVLHRGWGVPWDANDVVLNALGAALGCAWILAFASCERAPSPPRGNLAPTVATALVLGAGPVALWAAGLLAVHPEDGDAWIVLARVPRPESRWEVPEWGRGHHVAHPGTALVVCLALLAACAWLDRRVRWRPRGFPHGGARADASGAPAR